jgi:hypothetical protein
LPPHSSRLAWYSVKTVPSLPTTTGVSPFSRRGETARRMAGATTARVARVTVDLAVMARATAARVRMALLRGADRVDREIVVPTVAAHVVNGADLMVLLADQGLADLGLADLVVAPVVPMVLAAVAQDVVRALVDLVAGRAEGVSSSGWIRLIASSTKSCDRLSP